MNVVRAIVDVTLSREVFRLFERQFMSNSHIRETRRTVRDFARLSRLWLSKNVMFVSCVMCVCIY